MDYSTGRYVSFEDLAMEIERLNILNLPYIFFSIDPNYCPKIPSSRVRVTKGRKRPDERPDERPESPMVSANEVMTRAKTALRPHPREMPVEVPCMEVQKLSKLFEVPILSAAAIPRAASFDSYHRKQ